MIDRPPGYHIDHPPSWPAWCASLFIHASLLATLLFWLQPRTPLGVVDQPGREVGIVLKQTTDEGPLFEGEDDQPPTESLDNPDNNNNNDNNDPLLASLPAATEIPSSDAALPQLPTFGSAGIQQEPAGNVGDMASGGTPSKQLGSKASVSVFGVTGTGTRFVYVFDRSISMAGPPLRAAKQQLIASLASLDSVHQFQIIFFNHEPQAWDLTGGQQRIAFATDANKRFAEKFVQGVSATGGTFRRTALQMALRLGPDVLFFLTDTDDPMAAADLQKAIRRAQRSATAIHTIEFGTGPATSGENFLVRLARQTQGDYVYIDIQQLAR